MTTTTITGYINGRVVGSQPSWIMKECLSVHSARIAIPIPLQLEVQEEGCEGTPLLYLRHSCCIAVVLNSLVVTLVVLLFLAHRPFYRAILTTGISSTLCKVVPQGHGGVPTIPGTPSWPPLMRKTLDCSNLDWNHFQHIWITQFLCSKEGCEKEYPHTLVPCTWLPIGSK